LREREAAAIFEYELELEHEYANRVVAGRWPSRDA